MATAVLFAAIVVLVLWWAPVLQADRATDITSPRDRLELENELRRTLATVVAGAFVLFSGFIAWRNMRLLQEGQSTAREGQISERFTRAIEQLGSTHDDGSPRLELRLGGIYALERIARESEVDHDPVMEILTAYVREHAPRTSTEETHGTPRADIQAVMTVIGRRTRTLGDGEVRRLNLRGVDLSGAELRKAQLEGADFHEALLSRIDLRGARLGAADLEGAMLRSANLRRATLFGANLFTARLEGADLTGADLRTADLRGAQMAEAQLEGADFTGADLDGVDLRLVFTTGARGLEDVDRQTNHLS